MSTKTLTPGRTWTLDIDTADQGTAPDGMTDAAWEAVFGAIVTSRAVGSRQASTRVDGIEYRTSRTDHPGAVYDVTAYEWTEAEPETFTALPLDVVAAPVCRAAFPFGSDANAECNGCGNAVSQHHGFDPRDMIAAGFRVLPANVVDLAVEALGHAGTDNATSFTCGEAEDIADLMRAADHPEDAEAFIESHADGDDVGDSHVCATCEAVTKTSGTCSEDADHEFDVDDEAWNAQVEAAKTPTD